ncbi:MAG: hypothetical protein RLO23_02040 [Alphaproteobacteria bacterium]
MTRLHDPKTVTHLAGALLLGLGLATAFVAIGHSPFTLKGETAIVKPALAAVEAPSEMERPRIPLSRKAETANVFSGDAGQKEVDARTRRLTTLLAIGLLLQAGR